jgi:acyl-CoA synthetase (AMP-forming)/AMP-acid ligase II
VAGFSATRSSPNLSSHDLRIIALNNIAESLSQQAINQPDAVALVMPRKKLADGWAGDVLTYAELNEQVDAFARGMVVRGLQKGVRVAMMVPPSPMFFITFFALLRAGGIPILIDPGIGLKPLGQCLKEAEPELFIGISKAQWARRLLGWAKHTIRGTITVGGRWGQHTDRHLMKLGRAYRDSTALPEVHANDPAAILFTSGSTGIPKGVVYRHRHFQEQVRLIKETYQIEAGEIDCPTFPPFALFDPALGMTTVIPPMDFTRPASVNPAMLVGLIKHYQVTNLFGSPALMNTLTNYTQAQDVRLPSIKRVLSAGAPVSPKVVERMHRAIAERADIHTPYGATEGLPVATISGREILAGLAARHRNGFGICVGRPLSANQVKIIEITDKAVASFAETETLGIEAIGEICVMGPSITDQYWARPEQTKSAKIKDDTGRIWHRMGDVGWLDDAGRLWFCGRKSERVITPDGVLFTECVEGIVNATPGVYRSALVGLTHEGPTQRGYQEPVVVVELEAGYDEALVVQSIEEILQERPLTRGIQKVIVRPKLPVDIRHNAKIRRGELARSLSTV